MGNHISKFVNLPDLKTANGPSLLELARHLTAKRTLAGMGEEYVSDLDHMNTLRELVKKLPMFLRAKWTGRAGSIIESDHRPEFELTRERNFYPLRDIQHSELVTKMNEGAKEMRTPQDYHKDAQYAQISLEHGSATYSRTWNMVTSEDVSMKRASVTSVLARGI